MEKQPSKEELFLQNREVLLEMLQLLADQPELADDDERLRGLIAKINRKARKKSRKERAEEISRSDRDKLARTQLFQANDEWGQGKLLPEAFKQTENQLLEKPQNCYICKASYRELHFFYHQMCPECAAINYQRREQSCDLSGRHAIVTGGRIKIGLEIVLNLLRWGAEVTVTTRFPENARESFAQIEDYESWKNRLHVYGLDLRNLPGVETFVREMEERLPALDILINNAAQTVKRPLDFYRELIAKESDLFMLKTNSGQLPAPRSELFPEGMTDLYGQPLDLREQNSWNQKLDEVHPVEMLEVQLVNSVSPFMLNSQLKPLMMRSQFERKFIVNVSAMEGKFNRPFKTVFHPHTNMAKAALNMMTRTSGDDYARDGIYMTSVDTGWITDENPAPKKERLRAQGFVPPLDLIDGAMRVLAPVVDGLSLSKTPESGVFLKDYALSDW